jgi:hypothetical protein
MFFGLAWIIEGVAVTIRRMNGREGSMSSKAEWRDMDEWERRACDALVNVRFPVASAPKRAARNLTAQRASGKITNKQATALLWPLIARFRRQIPDKELVAYSAKAMGMSILREDSAVARVEGRGA